MDAVTLHDFPGGLKLDPRKTTKSPLSVLPTPDRVRIPMLQHRGKPANVCVKVGEQVEIGTLIGRADGTFSANVHASIAGVVSDISPRVIAHRSGLSSVCVEITASEEQTHTNGAFKSDDFRHEDPNILRRLVAEAGIVGLGGASFPTALKLTAEADRTLHTLIINGAECAPYISCDETLMRESAEDVVYGTQVLLHILQVNRCLIALEQDKTDAISAITAALDRAGDPRLKLCLVHAKYPEGGERQLIQVLSGQEVPSTGLPVDIGYLCHNVGTAYAIYRMVCKGEALTHRIVTVCGDGVGNPGNVLAPVGAAISDLVDHCGGFNPGDHRLIIGGPMMGFTVESDRIPVDKGTNCILVLPDADARSRSSQMPCIRCGACEEVCPASLLPQQLYYHARSTQLERLPDLNLFDCIECGCCDYVCPSNLPLTQYFRYAKDELWFSNAQQKKSAAARERFEQREQRLQRQQQERDAARAARKKAARDTAQKKQDIDAAVARAQARKQSDESDT